MVVNIELENGSIKEYPTSYSPKYDRGENASSTIKRTCDISTKCDHLDCAIYAAEYRAKDEKSDFKGFLIVLIFWFSVAIFGFIKDSFWIGMGLSTSGLVAIFVIYSYWQSDKFAKKAEELIEFRDHSTINGVKAYKL